VRFDCARWQDLLHRLFAAGFYNKTFIWPSWQVYEPAIRRIAGLGVAPDEPDPDRYEWRNAHCDVLVVGGGACGMLAASLAARAGARVLLLDSDRSLGGGLNWDRQAPRTLADEAAREVAAFARVRVHLNTTAIGAYDHGVVTALERLDNPASVVQRCHQRWWRIRTKHLVLACGALEQPLAFPFNDRPGILLADAVRHYLNRYAVAVGRRVALATNNDSAYQVALDLRAAGIAVPCLLDTRADLPSDLLEAVRSAGITVHREAQIVRTRGDRRIEALEFVANDGTHQRTEQRIECDALGMSGGWNPVAHLYCQSGGRLAFDSHHACLVPDGQLTTVHVVGAAAGEFDTERALQRTRMKVAALLKGLGLAAHTDAPSIPPLPVRPARTATGALGYREHAYRDRTWFDFQHDVTVSDIDLAVRENLVSVEHVKRYTTVGMSVDQGKTSNLNALAVLAELTSRTIPEVGTTTFRPMFVPVTLGAIAGGHTSRFYHPRRLLPAHAQHEQLGAYFEDYATWQRPACYPRLGELHLAAIHREASGVRTGVGLFDASTLGKFLVRGPDAAEFLNRMYANTMSTLQPGKVRYGLMLKEQGVILDDGVCARLSEVDYWVNTTSSGAARMAGWFEEWLQCEWPQLRVVITDVTSAWATFTLAGPRAREVLAALASDIDVSREAFPHMHVRVGRVCGVTCRILRVSFTGELSYEISVPADCGAALWGALMAAGERFGIAPFGIEALSVLRTEKGYLHVGADTDGTTVPDDVGFGAAVSRKAGDFVGRRSLTLPENTRADRFQLVGLRCIGDPRAFRAGAHLLETALGTPPQRTWGYLTSATFSPTLGAHVGMGLLQGGRSLLGRRVNVFDSGRESPVEVVPPSHYDPSGTRLNA